MSLKVVIVLPGKKAALNTGWGESQRSTTGQPAWRGTRNGPEPKTPSAETPQLCTRFSIGTHQSVPQGWTWQTGHVCH